ncbi:hypothetical protein J5N97_013209 [Dioscorea zingiberensis]|uniref:PORR domain-containing protein n=1 Tax=Dioscorea zingiberensis TaxID=325984 RepID=A0A9D5CQ84_9LILI|nr:hypothetical protein J5N97_013209 [Dioscorea zingiberensis]
MLGLFYECSKIKALGKFKVGILSSVSSPLFNGVAFLGPFNCNLQRRWKKPVDSAQTRLENRTRDLRLDKLMSQLKKLKLILKLQELILKKRGQFISVQLLSKWKTMIGINIGIGAFLRKYPHIFELYTHPVKKNLCCKVCQKMVDLIEEEEKIMKESESAVVQRLKKLLLISTNGTLHIHALWLIRRELGLRDDFRKSLLPKYPDDFNVVFPDIIALASKEDSFVDAAVDIWREKEYREKWLSEFETKYAFPIQFPTGFKIEKGFREKLKNWQRLPYLKPYEKKDVIRARSCGGAERFEKRTVGILHELLSLTVEKMIEVERLAHFRKDFNMEINIRELLLEHPGIFYISTKGNTQTVFLREAYSKGCLVEPNPIYTVRRKMLDLVLLGCRNTNQMQPLQELEDRCNKRISHQVASGSCDGDWVIPILESCDERQFSGSFGTVRGQPEEDDAE